MATWLMPVQGEDGLSKNPEALFDDTVFICVDESLSVKYEDDYVWIFKNGKWADQPQRLNEPNINTVEVALGILIEAFKNDPNFAYGWHSNIATVATLEIENQTGIKCADKTGNIIATKLMKHLFDVETSKDMFRPLTAEDFPEEDKVIGRNETDT